MDRHVTLTIWLSYSDSDVDSAPTLLLPIWNYFNLIYVLLYGAASLYTSITCGSMTRSVWSSSNRCSRIMRHGEHYPRYFQ